MARIGQLAGACLLALFLCQITLAGETAEPSFDKWLEMLDEIDGINEGQLTFLPAMPAEDKQMLYHLQNRIKLKPNSLKTGWVELDQCHHNLGTLPKMAITFGRGKARNLEIVSFANIDKAWVDRDNIEVIGAKAASSICIRGEVKTFKQTAPDLYQLQNGPYLRRFLDGNFPMQLSLEVDYSATNLMFNTITPIQQKGFSIKTQRGVIRIQSTFEGKLNIVTYFE